MGQVYQATDTTLGRQVAIKILPDAFAADPDRLARFEREANGDWTKSQKDSRPPPNRPQDSDRRNYFGVSFNSLPPAPSVST